MLMHRFGFSERYVVSSAIEITFPSVCLSVCPSVTSVSCAKTDYILQNLCIPFGRTEIRFGCKTNGAKIFITTCIMSVLLTGCRRETMFLFNAFYSLTCNVHRAPHVSFYRASAHLPAVLI